MKNVEKREIPDLRSETKVSLFSSGRRMRTINKTRFWTFPKTKKIKKLEKSVLSVVRCLQKSSKRVILSVSWWKVVTDMRGELFPEHPKYALRKSPKCLLRLTRPFGLPSDCTLSVRQHSNFPCPSYGPILHKRNSPHSPGVLRRNYSSKLQNTHSIFPTKDILAMLLTSPMPGTTRRCFAFCEAT